MVFKGMKLGLSRRVEANFCVNLLVSINLRLAKLLYVYFENEMGTENKRRAFSFGGGGS